jgi:hypothetical protein
LEPMVFQMKSGSEHSGRCCNHTLSLLINKTGREDVEEWAVFKDCCPSREN